MFLFVQLCTRVGGSRCRSLPVLGEGKLIAFDSFCNAVSPACHHLIMSLLPHPGMKNDDGMMGGNVDPLILTLSVILLLIILLLAFIILMSNRRFLKKKIWPVIPTPEHEFRDLFTIYKGNFQLWMGHQSAYLWWSQSPTYLEEQPFLVELLSECDGYKVDGLPPPPPPLPPKIRTVVEQLPETAELSQDDYLVLDEGLAPCCSGGDGSLLLTDSESNEVTDLALPGGAGISEPSQASSSFEYTVFDPSSESLSPQHPHAESQLKSSYQMVSDSGISADYSLGDSSAEQMGRYTNLCDGGGTQPFVPTYIICS
ncbi:Erythropoietin receptor [Varanus komodoensis]|nr:Erythropoietin receptor [Varanus komodoensis]